VLRAIDKLDRLGIDGVRALLGAGRKDESGDFTKGAELSEDAVNLVLQFLTVHARDEDFYTAVRTLLGEELWKRGADDLVLIANLCEASGYMSDRVQLDPSVVRGLDYYTGAVYEAQLTFQVANESGETVVFGSIGGGGRYDDLVARFTGQTVPAAGFSIGVSRLLSALKARTGAEVWESKPLVVVLTIDRDRIARSFKLAAELRAAGLRAEAYLGTRKFGDQLKYADHRGAAVAIIEGSDERARGEVTVKDLRLGAELAKSIADRAAWVRDRPAQRAVKRADMVAEIRAILARKG
jgi:histidyl-tRNA synthetase